MIGPSLASDTYSWLLMSRHLFLAIHILGVLCFAYIVSKRLVPLQQAERDFRFDRPLQRAARVFKFWLGQWKHPRYKFAGILHILIFSGFIVLVVHTFSVLIGGISQNFEVPRPSGQTGHLYEMIIDYAATIVFLCMVVATVRRLVFKPARYAVPARYGKAHRFHLVKVLIADAPSHGLQSPSFQLREINAE